MATLTKAIKDRMIRLIMADIPKPDIETLAKNEFVAAVEERLPDCIKQTLRDPKWNDFICQQRVTTDCGKIYFYCHGPNRYLYKLDDWIEYAGAEAIEKLRTRCAEVRARDSQRATIQNELNGNFSSVRTIKQFEDRFPELAKYLPERTAVANLPATNDLIEKLKAAGLQSEEAKA